MITKHKFINVYCSEDEYIPRFRVYVCVYCGKCYTDYLEVSEDDIEPDCEDD